MSSQNTSSSDNDSNQVQPSELQKRHHDEDEGESMPQQKAPRTEAEVMASMQSEWAKYVTDLEAKFKERDAQREERMKETLRLRDQEQAEKDQAHASEIMNLKTSFLSVKEKLNAKRVKTLEDTEATLRSLVTTLPDPIKEKLKQGKFVKLSSIKSAMRPAHARENATELKVQDGVAKLKTAKESFTSTADLMDTWITLLSCMFIFNEDLKSDMPAVLDLLAYTKQLTGYLVNYTPTAVELLDFVHRGGTDSYEKHTHLANIDNNKLSTFLTSTDNRRTNTFCNKCRVTKNFCTCEKAAIPTSTKSGTRNPPPASVIQRCTKFNRHGTSGCKDNNCKYKHECNKPKCTTRNSHGGCEHDPTKHE